MNYRSIADLSMTIRQNLSKVPFDVDLIVGVPRSGMLPASILALNLNMKFCDVDAYLSDSALANGRTRLTRTPELERPSDARHVLVLDDSVDSGESMHVVRRKIMDVKRAQKVTYGAVFATPRAKNEVDIHFEVLSDPRLFEWNLMHRPFLAECCFDLDGVICIDPTDEQNDDGSRYRDFLLSAKPLVIPSYPLGHIVTSRLEKYRRETETWLGEQGVVYERLHMLDLPNAEARRRLGCHASYKAEVFRRLVDARLFVESDRQQASDIARLSGKHALSFTTQEMFDPTLTYALVAARTQRLSVRVRRKIARVLASMGGRVPSGQ